MEERNPLSLPESPPPTRTAVLNIRLTASEDRAVRELARQLGLPTSRMARHFLLQAVRYYHNHLPAREVETHENGA